MIGHSQVSPEGAVEEGGEEVIEPEEAAFIIS
jgi:hypothetical protein